MDKVYGTRKTSQVRAILAQAQDIGLMASPKFGPSWTTAEVLQASQFATYGLRARAEIFWDVQTLDFAVLLPLRGESDHSKATR